MNKAVQIELGHSVHHQQNSQLSHSACPALDIFPEKVRVQNKPSGKDYPVSTLTFPQTSYFEGITTKGVPLLGRHMSTWASFALGLPMAFWGMGSI